MAIFEMLPCQHSKKGPIHRDGLSRTKKCLNALSLLPENVQVQSLQKIALRAENKRVPLFLALPFFLLLR